MEHLDAKILKLRATLLEIDDLIRAEIGSNPWEEVEKSIKIVTQRNYKQFPSIERKIKELVICIYNSGMRKNVDAICEKVDIVYKLLPEFNS